MMMQQMNRNDEKSNTGPYFTSFQGIMLLLR
jgi:hypothetical protein